MEYYNHDELKEIILRSSDILGVKIDNEGALSLGMRSRGTPRIANRLLKRVRDYSMVKGIDIIDSNMVEQAAELLEVDKEGFDRLDNKILESIIDNFNGGPVGGETLSYFIGEEVSTIEDVYEPYLIQRGFIVRTPRGRIAAKKAYNHLGRIIPDHLL